MIEPEVLRTGGHSLEKDQQVTSHVWIWFLKQLKELA